MSKTSYLKWHCRRGMKELDILLTTYLEQMYPHASPAEQQAFESLLTLPDPELYDYILDRQTVEEPQCQLLINKIKSIINLK